MTIGKNKKKKKNYSSRYEIIIRKKNYYFYKCINDQVDGDWFMYLLDDNDKGDLNKCIEK